jgi:hypothetical protein
MSNDKDSKDPGPEDDGWGAAASEGEAASEAQAPAADVSFDPVGVEDRVAALRANRSQADESAGDVESKAETSATKPSTAPEQPTSSHSEPTKSVQEPLAAQPTKPVQEPLAAQPTTTTPSQTPASTPAASATPLAAQTIPSGAAPALAPSGVDDAPQWSKSDSSGPTNSSDMQVLAALDEQPAAKKRRKRAKRLKKDPKTQLTRRQQFFLIGGAAALVVAVVCAVLGWLNSQNYYLVCGTQSITAEQGSFWPYGRSALSGEEFKGIVGDHPCTSRQFESREELERAFLAELIGHATQLLSPTKVAPEQVLAAEQELGQALLLSRDPERGEERAMAERLKGDVSYWKGAAEIQGALETLRKSATLFEEAATRLPRHSRDSSEWAEHARFIASEIDKGPRALRKDESAKEEPHFQGLGNPDGPVKPTEPTEQEPDTQVTPEAPIELPADAGVDAAPPEVPADASLPTGGVLL